MYWDTDAPRDSFYYVNQWGPEYEADKAIEYLNGHIDKTQPFALVLSMNPPHTGYELVPDRYKSAKAIMVVRSVFGFIFSGHEIRTGIRMDSS